jgi:hypothetical protein
MSLLDPVAWRPAVVAVERADEGMRREFRLLTALKGTDVPHPAPVSAVVRSGRPLLFV